MGLISKLSTDVSELLKLYIGQIITYIDNKMHDAVNLADKDDQF